MGLRQRLHRTVIAAALLCGAAAAASYSYDQSDLNYGPAQWGSLPGASLCSGSSFPSPIDLKFDLAQFPVESAASLVALDMASRETVPSRVVVSNDGAHLYFTFGSDQRYTYIRDPTNAACSTSYQLDFLRIHTLSEHTVGTSHFGGEIQIHFKASTASPRCSGDKDVLVVVLLVVVNRIGSSEALQKLLDLATVLPSNFALSSSVNSTTLTQATTNNPGAFRVSMLMPQRGQYLAYDGSLSNPPCTRNYRYIVMLQTVRVDDRAFAYLRSRLSLGTAANSAGIIPGNWRPTQTSAQPNVRYFRANGPLSDFQVTTTGTGTSSDARKYSIVALVMSALALGCIGLAIVNINAMVTRVENAVTEMQTTAAGGRPPKESKEPMKDTGATVAPKAADAAKDKKAGTTSPTPTAGGPATAASPALKKTQ